MSAETSNCAIPTRIVVNLGCGPLAKRTSWVDCDGSWNARLNALPVWVQQVIRSALRGINSKMHQWPAHVRYINLLKPLPFASDSVDAVYASHVWEHLYRQDAEKVTREVLRVLKPGGVLRLAVPNLEYYCRAYLSDVGSAEAAGNLNEKLLLRLAARPAGIKSLYAAFADFHSHKFMYDAPSLCALLKGAGFEPVERKEAFDSRIPEIVEVESEERVSPTAGIAVEGVKPA